MATETLRPNAAGAETSVSYQYPTSGEHWDKVDEESPDEFGTDIRTANNLYERDLYALPAHSIGSGTINFIKIYFRCTCEFTGKSFAKPSLKSDTTVTDGTEVSVLGDYIWTTFSQQWNTNPADGGTWSWDDIDALQIGVSLKSVGNHYCTQVYVEVDYTAAAAAFKGSRGFIIG